MTYAELADLIARMPAEQRAKEVVVADLNGDFFHSRFMAHPLTTTILKIEHPYLRPWGPPLPMSSR